MSNIWDERYSNQEYVYGENPNVFFAEQLGRLIPGNIILPCDGEGRNAVHAASKGWNVQSFDLSEAGKSKALALANKKGVIIHYVIEDAVVAMFPGNSVEVVAFIYAHFPPAIRKSIHQKAVEWLQPGGRIILEAFNPNQLQKSSGGPKELSMLYTEEIIKEDFKGLKIDLVQTLQTTLMEGKYHEGPADIIQFVGIKA